ncbi:ribosomal L1 domain-containing protein CG13096 [Pieris brassicae]|uniref:ribosomal L1 domain-containing protein CG13096 n=1 Tax=Pieris brassicae TaxID=7116 RepID=UPI001E66092C|nr:ribosomal L1 domain-containing protein CG13096 [Pieris brassicae]
MVAVKPKLLEKQKVPGIKIKSKKPFKKTSTSKEHVKSNNVKNKLKETSIVSSTKKKVKYIYPSKAINENLLDLSLNALSKLTENYNTKNMIFGDENPIFLQIRCIKIQNSTGNIKFVLPHSTAASTGEICLITPDLKKGKKPDHEPTIEHWEDLLRKAGVTSVKTILPMRQLRVEYDQFELRRRLMTQHDFIMVDTRVLNHVSHHLGNMFFKKHNMLIPVNINEKKDLKKDIDVGLRTVMLRLNEGAISNLVVGHTGMPQAHIKENILAIIKQLAERYPGGEPNIRSLCLKLPLSLSLPIYMTLRPSNLIAPPKIKKHVPKEFREYEDELSTIPGAIVKIAPGGSTHVKLKKEKLPRTEDNKDDTQDEEMDESSDNESE